MLLASWPGFRLISRGKQYMWEGRVQPTPLSSVYTIRITYAEGNSPKVYVVNPTLEPRHDAAIPHRYADGGLCLNLPGEWSSERCIAEMIIPWISLWLYHYEAWRITGEWLGGGVHPTCKPIQDSVH